MATPFFIDTAFAAEMLRISKEGVLDLVRDGTLKPYGGRAPNLFFRTSDVKALAPVEVESSELDAPRRTKSASARVQARLTAEARWSDVSDDDMREWISRAEGPRRQAGRKAALVGREKLDRLLAMLEDTSDD